MRLKKGFTLAEILIVLMVIGTIATMTIPSLMRGVQDAQYKTAYKKAFNAITNIAAMENVSGNLPATNDAAAVETMYKTLKSSLSVKDFADRSTNLTTGGKVDVNDVLDNDTTLTGAGANWESSPWITTEDNLSYMVATVQKYKTMAGITNVQSEADAGKCVRNGQEVECDPDVCRDKTQVSADWSYACVVVVVDVNGITSSPNKIEPQVAGYTFGADTQLDQLTGDLLPIYIGTNGATAGSKKVKI